MVVSRINKTIKYAESKEIEDDDHNLESSTYNIVIGRDREIIVTFGKAKYDKDVVYYPMYIVDGNKTNGKIGVLEFQLDKMASILDDDGDIDANAIDDPLIFDFVNDEYFEENEKEKEEEEIKDTIFDIDEPPVLQLESGNILFEIDIHKKQPTTLFEEDKSAADILKAAYVESPKNEWIERYMKNNKYAIHSGSDCIFSVIRDAFEQICQNVSVDKLRDVLANELTDEIYQTYRNAALNIESEIHDGESRIKSLQSSIKELKKRIKKVTSKSEHESIVKQAKEFDSQCKSIKQLNDNYKVFSKQHFGIVENLDTYAKFQECIRKTGRCVDKWAFHFLEKTLNVKLIMFSESAFADDSLDSVLDCGEKGPSAPNYYIIVSYKGSKYRLVSYKDKKILTYREIPFDIRMLIVNKCKEHNSAGFDSIQDFRNLKTKYGAPLDYSDDDGDEVLQFYGKADSAAYPGTGSGERVPLDQLHHYLELFQTDNWRRKLDDHWTHSPFTLDNKKWASVEHYYQGSKYKKGYPEFYDQFSLTNDGELSKDPYLAKMVGGKAPHSLKLKGATIDPDFYGGRNLAERDLAIQAKFEQNPTLVKLLAATRNASLNMFKRGYKSEKSTFLMKLRKDLCAPIL